MDLPKLSNYYNYRGLLILTIVIIAGGIYLNEFYNGPPILQLLGYEAEEAPAQTAPAQTSPPPRSVPRPAPRTAPYVPPAPAPPQLPFVATATPEEYARLEQIMPQNEMIQKLPEDAKIQINFYNNNRGYWESEKSYVISRGSMTQGTIPDPEFKFGMNAIWVNQFTETNFCEIMQQARARGESTVEVFGSKMALTWKYKGVIGYRDCLGF